MDTNKFFTGEGKRERSLKQEKKLARLSNGNVTVNSGATFGDADVKIKTQSAQINVEAKYTDKEQYILKKDTLEKLKAQSKNKIPMMEIKIQEEKWYLIRPQEYFMLLELFENGGE